MTRLPVRAHTSSTKRVRLSRCLAHTVPAIGGGLGQIRHQQPKWAHAVMVWRCMAMVQRVALNPEYIHFTSTTSAAHPLD